MRIKIAALVAALAAVLKVFSRASEYDPERDALVWALGIAAWECRTIRRKRERRGKSRRWRSRAPRVRVGPVALVAAARPAGVGGRRGGAGLWETALLDLRAGRRAPAALAGPLHRRWRRRSCGDAWPPGRYGGARMPRPCPHRGTCVPGPLLHEARHPRLHRWRRGRGPAHRVARGGRGRRRPLPARRGRRGRYDGRARLLSRGCRRSAGHARRHRPRRRPRSAGQALIRFEDTRRNSACQRGPGRRNCVWCPRIYRIYFRSLMNRSSGDGRALRRSFFAPRPSTRRSMPSCAEKSPGPATSSVAAMHISATLYS